jgi:nucleoside-specific outer membrane channel protein Tsx
MVYIDTHTRRGGPGRVRAPLKRRPLLATSATATASSSASATDDDDDDDDDDKKDWQMTPVLSMLP